MDSRSNNTGATDSNANRASSNNRYCGSNNNYKWTNCNKSAGSNIPKQKTWKKHTYIVYNNDKRKAVLVKEPGLEPLSTQFKQLEKDVMSYARANMSGQVSQAMEDLSKFDFDPLMPKPVSPGKWKVKDTNDKGDVTLVKSPDLKEIFKDILRSEIINYTKKISKYKIDMQLLYEIVLGNLDVNVRTLIESDTTFASIHTNKDPIGRRDIRNKVWFIHPIP